MEYARLGRTEENVSRLIFGCGMVGGLMINAAPETMAKAVDLATKAGINWFDTAARYGDGKSEENLGRTLRELGLSPSISSKFHVLPGEGDIPGQIERAVEQGLKRLGMDRIELYQLHNNILSAESDKGLTADQILGAGGVVETLESLRGQGLLKYIGVTAIGDAPACCQVINSGHIDTAQVYYNMINPSSALLAGSNLAGGGHDFTGILDACAEADVGVIAIRTLAAGALASDAYDGRAVITRDSEPDDERVKAAAVNALLGQKFGSRQQSALRFALAHPQVSCIDFAAGTVAHLEEAIDGADMGPLPEDALRDLAKLYQSNFGRG